MFVTTKYSKICGYLGFDSNTNIKYIIFDTVRNLRIFAHPYFMAKEKKAIFGVALRMQTCSRMAIERLDISMTRTDLCSPWV